MTMAFRFRLAPILRYRKRCEDEHALGLARALRRREAAERELVMRRREIEAGREALVAAGVGGAPGMALHLLADTVARASRWAAAAGNRLAGEQARVDRARQDLVEASRGRRILERLETTQRGLYRRRDESREQRQLDDVASRYHLWRNAGKRSGGGSER